MINFIELAGYKSISYPQRVNFAGLTVLAGANSSGKSAIMQPLLIWKQTVECSYDPGALLLDGPNIRITAGDQILSKIRNKELNPSSFTVQVGVGHTLTRLAYRRSKNGSFKIASENVARDHGPSLDLAEGNQVENSKLGEFASSEPSSRSQNMVKSLIDSEFLFRAVRQRCFLMVEPYPPGGDLKSPPIGISIDVSDGLLQEVKRLIHVPGLRGNPERTYRATEVSNQFPGTYENYVASIITMWQEEAGNRKLGQLGDQLRLLGLTWKVSARKIEDTRVELRVGRMPQASRGGASDLVNIADVGLGVAQVLPILVALLSASKGQIVYVEQPELHLHPKAQWRLAEIVTEAVSRGVKIILETHSSVFLRGIQTQIALSKLDHSDVSFNWFTRNIDGNTVVSRCVPDRAGAVGDWPVDFDDVTLQAEGVYLDAISGGGE